MIATPKIFKINKIDKLGLSMTIKDKLDFLLINDSNNEIR